jgi:hypothetical protein
MRPSFYLGFTFAVRRPFCAVHGRNPRPVLGLQVDDANSHSSAGHIWCISVIKTPSVFNSRLNSTAVRERCWAVNRGESWERTNAGDIIAFQLDEDIELSPHGELPRKPPFPLDFLRGSSLNGDPSAVPVLN